MNYDPIIVKRVRALHDDVLVYDMFFGEQTTSSGIVIGNDDGTTRGIYPRWAKVYKVGPEQKDVREGQWILIEHGRWTRKIKIDDGESEKEIQKVETKSILAVSDERPNEYQIGQEYRDGAGVDIKPEDFLR